MNIRDFRMGDEAPLYRVLHSAVHRIASSDYTPEQLNAWAPDEPDHEVWMLKMRALQPFVAEIDGVIAGYADLQASGYIVHFFVSADFPRQGVGRLLMEHIHKQAAQLRLPALTSDVSKTAQPFYARFGFEIVEQRFPVRQGVTIPNALMRKILTRQAAA